MTTLPRAVLALLALAMLFTTPVWAETIRVTSTITKSGKQPQQPTPHQADFKVRDTTTGKVVAEGTIQGSKGNGGYRSGDVNVEPGKYTVEVHMRDSLTHYKDTTTVTVGKGKGKTPAHADLRRLDSLGADHHRTQGEIDKYDKRIDKRASEIKELEGFRDKFAKKGLDKHAKGFQDQIDEAERRNAKDVRRRNTRRKRLLDIEKDQKEKKKKPKRDPHPDDPDDEKEPKKRKDSDDDGDPKGPKEHSKDGNIHGTKGPHLPSPALQGRHPGPTVPKGKQPTPPGRY
ncbi:MAG: hypothetical protein JRG83_13460 [Deltaproteobacteria bacterium]|nr:hypothetical protein [Deltaproteobacteria bacterium]